MVMNISVYNSYSEHIRKRFDGRVQKITIDAKFTCPNRDGSKSVGGCSFCNNESFGTATKVRDLEITDQLLKGIEHAKGKYKNIKGFLAYFQSYSNTYAPLEKLKEIYSEALNVPGVMGLSIGTRPDCIDLEKIKYLEDVAKEKEVIIEYGLESMFDETLDRVNRCHDYKCFTDAINLTKNRGIKICVHLIIGFPWETKEQWIETAREMSKLPIDYLKVHQLHIVKGTMMGNEYIAKPFELISKDDYMEVMLEFLENLNPKIVVQRLFGSASKDMTLSKHWPERVSELNNELILKMKERETYQGRLHN